ncbi:hypothetical protein MNBD_GAMMA16-2178 [hydrothermal vent metagenome]|uniref:RES domain-containing protein n=1 Tax=hydrothermal vent metagenome TaxID=652676 RepID=A0A3B1A180_9ZZZZ
MFDSLLFWWVSPVLSGVRKQLNIQLSDITSNDYSTTQRIGAWAQQQGYKDLLVPSARNLTGANFVAFGGF